MRESSKVGGGAPFFSFNATLIKSHYVKTPKSAILYTRKDRGMILLDCLTTNLTITTSLHLTEVMKSRKNYTPFLRQSHK